MNPTAHQQSFSGASVASASAANTPQNEVVEFKNHKLRKISSANNLVNCSNCRELIFSQENSKAIVLDCGDMYDDICYKHAVKKECLTCKKLINLEKLKTYTLEQYDAKNTIFRCMQKGCYFGISQEEIETKEQSKPNPDIKQITWLIANKEKQSVDCLAFQFQDAIFDFKQQLSARIRQQMIVDGFDAKDSRLTQEKIIKNLEIKASATLDKNYLNDLIYNDQNETCPYFLNMFAEQPSNAILTHEGIDKIITLIANIMQQQDIIVECQVEESNTIKVLVLNSDVEINEFSYNLREYKNNYNTATEAMAELIKEIEIDKIFFMIARDYPQVFMAKNWRKQPQKYHIVGWDTQHLTIIEKEFMQRPNSRVCTSLKEHHINHSLFFDTEKMVFNFDLLKFALENKGISYKEMFKSTIVGFNEREVGNPIPEGLMPKTAFLRLPVK